MPVGQPKMGANPHLHLSCTGRQILYCAWPSGQDKAFQGRNKHLTDPEAAEQQGRLRKARGWGTGGRSCGWRQCDLHTSCWATSKASLAPLSRKPRFSINHMAEPVPGHTPPTKFAESKQSKPNTHTQEIRRPGQGAVHPTLASAPHRPNICQA